MRKRDLVPAFVIAACIAVFATAGPASADAVYHTEHLGLTPIGGAPLRSGFVQNIQAEGPTIYAHEIYVLSGALPNDTYTVVWNGYLGDPDPLGNYPGDPTCSLDPSPYPSAMLDTNAAGNARGDVKYVPEDVVGLPSPIGVIWTFFDSAGELAYTTTCTSVSLH
jgi:hypothetical protein